VSEENAVVEANEVGLESKLSIFGRVALFYRQVISELKRVVWPTRNQLTTYTAVVLVFVGFIIVVVSAFDLVLTKIVFWVFG
jgi:preprotein translocase subunit SecE